MQTALLISTYNWPQALRVILSSVSNQSMLPEEILIADDGSNRDTLAVINEFKERIAVPIFHVWQEDKGFRKSIILNKAVAKSRADYIIQIDGDCLLHPHFIKDHLLQASLNKFLFGSRVNIKSAAVEKVLRQGKIDFSIFSEEIKNKSRNLHLPALQNFYKPTAEFSSKTRGCNLSYWRNDFLAVNGYDETMEGWGREDSELVIRLLNKGVLGQRLRYGGIVYHLHHPEKSKEFLERNHQIQQETIQQRKTWCEQGVAKYLKQ